MGNYFFCFLFDNLLGFSKKLHFSKLLNFWDYIHMFCFCMFLQASPFFGVLWKDPFFCFAAKKESPIRAPNP